MYFKSKPDYTCVSSPFIYYLQVMYFKSKLDYTCASSPFIYNPTGHVTIDHLNIINSTSL